PSPAPAPCSAAPPRPWMLSAGGSCRSHARDERQLARACLGGDLPAALGREHESTRLESGRVAAGNRRPCWPRIGVEPSPGDGKLGSLRPNPEHLIAFGARDHADRIPSGPDGAVRVDVPRTHPERIRMGIARWLRPYG